MVNIVDVNCTVQLNKMYTHPHKSILIHLAIVLKKSIYIGFSTGFVFGFFSCYKKKGQKRSTILLVIDQFILTFSLNSTIKLENRSYLTFCFHTYLGVISACPHNPTTLMKILRVRGLKVRNTLNVINKPISQSFKYM